MGLGSKAHFASAVVGGLVVAGGFLVFGISGTQRIETVVEEAPVAAQTPDNRSGGLTPHDIYQRDAPGVVFVHATLVDQVANPFDLFHARESDTSTGSGFLVDKRGDILTNFHIIEGAARSGGVTVEFENEATRPASVVAVDPNDDLAVLRVDMRHVPRVMPLTTGDSTSVRVGDPTLTIGNPFGIDRTLTSGIVSALQHQIQAADGRTIDNVIQTDQSVAAGNSGAPLLDADGRVVGINSQVAISAGGGGGVNETVSFAIPIDTADSVLARVDGQQALRVAYIGIAARLHLKHPNAVVGKVDKDGPAAQAGVRVGDSIQRVDDVPVASISDMLAIVSTYSPGQTVQLLIRRHGHPTTVSVGLGSTTVGAAG
jgi:S1-C subfamily serine protease